MIRFSLVDFGENNGPRRDMESHLNATLLGLQAIRTLSITEVLQDGTDGRILTYNDVFPTKYVFPQFSASGTGIVFEEIHLRPNSFDQQ